MSLLHLLIKLGLTGSAGCSDDQGVTGVNNHGGSVYLSTPVDMECFKMFVEG